jgi:hypothetical protein
MKKLTVLFLALAFWAGFCTPAAATQYIYSTTKGTVTIASGAATGTTDVGPAATGTYILLYNGCSTSAAASNAQSLARLSVSGDTVTATRSTTAGSTTVTCAFSLIDAHANLVTSVQSGTISLTTTSNTATISSVTTANSSVFWQGATQTVTTFNGDCNSTVLSLTNSTTVTANILQAGCVSGTTVVGYQVVNWNPSALNSNTQQFATTWVSSGTSSTQAITSVTPTNTMLAFAGGGSPDGNVAWNETPRIDLTNSTTVTVTIGVAPSNDEQVNFTVIEFVSGVLKQSAQRGTTVIAAGSNSNTSSITSASTTETAVNFTGWSTSETATTTHATIMPRITQTDATTLTSNVNTNVAAGDNVTLAWEALTFEESAGGGGGDTSDASSMFQVF